VKIGDLARLGSGSPVMTVGRGPNHREATVCWFADGEVHTAVVPLDALVAASPARQEPEPFDERFALPQMATFGVGLREYFAAHAPSRAPDFFLYGDTNGPSEPEHPICKLPLELREAAKQWIENQSADPGPGLKEFADAYRKYGLDHVNWRTASDVYRQARWRWAWADAMLAARSTPEPIDAIQIDKANPGKAIDLAHSLGWKKVVIETREDGSLWLIRELDAGKVKKPRVETGHADQREV